MSRFAYPLNPFDPDLPLCIFGIGREDDQPPVIRKNGFPFPQLFFCLSGKGTLEVNGKSFPVKEGSFCILWGYAAMENNLDRIFREHCPAAFDPNARRTIPYRYLSIYKQNRIHVTRDFCSPEIRRPAWQSRRFRDFI